MNASVLAQAPLVLSIMDMVVCPCPGTKHWLHRQTHLITFFSKLGKLGQITSPGPCQASELQHTLLPTGTSCG